MPIIGEIESGKKLGYKCGNKFIWQSCVDCGEERWVIISESKPQYIRCRKCSMIEKGIHQRGSNHPNWKGGRHHQSQGYIMVYLYPNNPFITMAIKSGYVKEHRLMMAKHLGRCLEPWEIVHHKNHIRDDNKIENLEIISDGIHKGITILEDKINRLLRENLLLKSRNRELCKELCKKNH